MKHFIYQIPRLRRELGLTISQQQVITLLRNGLMLSSCGDHWDMPSLSKYDEGKKASEALVQRRY